MNRKALVVAAHPDDELLGIGGTIAKWVAEGNEARCIILGEGQTSRFDSAAEADQKLVEELHGDSMKAAELVGYSQVIFSKFPDNRFDGCDLLDIVKVIEALIEEYQPEVVYTQHAGDLNIDHQITFRAVTTATRPLPGSVVKRVYTFETLSSTEWSFGGNQVFEPNTFVDIEEYIDVKIKAMECYSSEMREFPHPRSAEGILALAQTRGSMVGIKYAEALKLIRSLA